MQSVSVSTATRRRLLGALAALVVAIGAVALFQGEEGARAAEVGIKTSAEVGIQTSETADLTITSSPTYGYTYRRGEVITLEAAARLRLHRAGGHDDHAQLRRRPRAGGARLGQRFTYLALQVHRRGRRPRFTGGLAVIPGSISATRAVMGKSHQISYTNPPRSIRKYHRVNGNVLYTPPPTRSICDAIVINGLSITSSPGRRLRLRRR